MTSDKDIYWEKIMILIVYAANNRASKYMKQLIQLKGEIHKYSQWFQQLSATDSISRQNFNKNIQDLKNKFHQGDLIDYI